MDCVLGISSWRHFALCERSCTPPAT